MILVDETTGERIVLWDRDDRLRLRERELPIEALTAARVVHVDDVDDDAAVRAATDRRAAAGAMVTSDIDRLTPRTEELAAAVTHAIFAQHVPPHLTGTRRHGAALRKLRQRHDQVLCVTAGRARRHGARRRRFYQEPAFSVRAVDTTGAGDVFRGGFIYALLQGQPMRAGAAHRQRRGGDQLHPARRAERRPGAREVNELIAAGTASV